MTGVENMSSSPPCMHVWVCAHEVFGVIILQSDRGVPAQEEVSMELALANFHVFIYWLFPCIHYFGLKNILQKNSLFPGCWACQLFN